MTVQEAQEQWWANVQNNIDRLKLIWPGIENVKNLDELAAFYGRHVSLQYEQRFRNGLSIPRKSLE